MLDSSFVHEMSWTCPPLAINRNGLPPASTARCSLVFRPPQERPKACWPYFLRHRMLVCSDDRRVDQDLFDLRSACYRERNRAATHVAPPSGKSDVQGVPGIEVHRHVAPSTSSTAYPQHRFGEPAVVGSRSTPVAFLAGNIDSTFSIRERTERTGKTSKPPR